MLSLAVLPFLVSSVASSAQEYKGAERILHDLSAAQSAPQGDLASEAAAVRESYRTLSPEQAAKSWYRLATSPLLDSVRYRYVGAANPVLAVLPPPSSWNAIAKLTENPANGGTPVRRAAIRAMAYELLNDPANEWRALAALEILTTKETVDEPEASRIAIGQVMLDVAASLRDFGKFVHACDLVSGTPTEYGFGSIVVPDPVRLFGRQKAVPFVTRVLLAPRRSVSFGEGPARELARGIALQNVAKLKVAPWDLVDSSHPQLYQALTKRFRTIPKGDGESAAERTGAAQAYGRYLLRQSKVAQALAVATSAGTLLERSSDLALVNDPSVPQAAKTSFYKGIYEYVASHPNSNLWPDSSVGIDPEPYVRKALANPAATGETRNRLRRSLIDVLLAKDKINDALALVRKGPGETSQLISLGTALRDGALMKEGLAIAERLSPGGRLADEANTDSYVKAGLGPEIEKSIEMEWRAGAAAGGDMAPNDGDSTLCALIGLYYCAGRYADIVRLLDDAPFWSNSDVADIAMMQVVRDDPLGFVVAKSLVEVGRRPEALPLVVAVLRARRDYDPAYELLLDLQGDAAMGLIENLHKADPFEERPLIWKAVLLRRQGKLAQAEESARAAIELDPTDGEEGYGRRLYSYSVLASILEDRGKNDEAKKLRSVVEAVRLGERADDLAEAGLRSRAIALYRKSLGVFADAYCLEARLAVQMMQDGDTAGAERHYRRAYELMPSQFGRMESECFGCEGIFTGTQARSVAESVFQRLAKEQPSNPKVFYLLGNLRAAQNRSEEAVSAYRQAVALDPEYLNAWRNLQQTAESLGMQDEARRAGNALARLSPLGARAFRLPAGGDFRTVWANFDRALSLLPPEPKSLYPLGRNARTNRPTTSVEAVVGFDQVPKSPSEVVAQRLSTATLLGRFSRTK